MADNKEMKTLGGYEIVDEKARQDINIVAEKADEAYSLAKGATKAFVYDTYADMISELNALDKAELLVNFHVMIREVCVPDLWISGVSDEHVEYTYTSNEDFIVDLTEDGIVQVGYFILSALETQNVDLSEYVKNTDYAFNKVGVVKIQNVSSGLQVNPNSGEVSLASAPKSVIDEKSNTYRAITPSNLDYAVKKALSDCKLTDDDVWTAEEQAAAIERIGLKDYIKYKYFNFQEAGVNVEGNPTYDEIKEAILSDVTPVLIHGHYIAHMTSGHWDAEAFEREELPGFTFVTHRSDMNNHWKIKYTEFWCTKQDDGSTLWVVGEHYYIEDFVAEYGVTTFSEIQNAYNHEKIMFCTHGGLVTKLDIFAPDNYAQFSGLDNIGNPALLKVTKDNNWTRINVTNATTDYVNGRIESVNNMIANQKTFVAEYNVTTFSEIQNSYNSGKAVICKDGWLVAKLDIFAPDDYAQFSGLDDEGNPALLKVYKNNSWIRKNAMKASADFVSRINSNVSSLENSVDSIAQYINGKDTLLSALSSMNTVDILKSVYNFRGGFRDNAGTLHIKNPGIYLVIAGGTGNKTITINYPTGKEFEATKWSGIILLAYESGAVTPIGIKSSLSFIDAFQMPGTFQGWTTDGSYSTTINYPAKCVVAYLGNGNVNYLA